MAILFYASADTGPTSQLFTAIEVSDVALDSIGTCLGKTRRHGLLTRDHLPVIERLANEREYDCELWMMVRALREHGRIACRVL